MAKLETPQPWKRVVLDTNALISALLFPRGSLAWLRHAWQSGSLLLRAAADT